MNKRKTLLALWPVAIAVMAVAAGLVVVPDGLQASSHREAPVTALDTKADITDLYDRVTVGTKVIVI